MNMYYFAINNKILLLKKEKKKQVDPEVQNTKVILLVFASWIPLCILTLSRFSQKETLSH